MKEDEVYRIAEDLLNWLHERTSDPDEAVPIIGVALTGLMACGQNKEIANRRASAFCALLQKAVATSQPAKRH